MQKTYTDVRNFLNEYAFAKARASALCSEIAAIWGILHQTEDVAALTGDDSNIPFLTERINRLDQQLLQAVEEITSRGELVLSIITSLEDPEIECVFEQRYLNNMKLEAIAIDMGCSLSKVKYLHREGLRQLKEYLDEG